MKTFLTCTKTYFFFLTLVFTGFTTSLSAAGVKGLLIGVDGFNNRYVTKERMPHLYSYFKESSYTLKARSVIPSSSVPNWGAILTGVTPDQNGVRDGGWTPENPYLDVMRINQFGFFPTLFYHLKNDATWANKGVVTTSLISQWGGLLKYVEKEVIDEVVYIGDTEKLYKTILDKIEGNQLSTFTMLHIDELDHLGHKYGHDSKEYLKGLEEVDHFLGKLKNALLQKGLWGKIALGLLSDHGGLGFGHRGFTMEEMLSPWLVMGPSIVKNHQLTSMVNNYDIFAQMAYAMDLAVPPYLERMVIGELALSKESVGSTGSKTIFKTFFIPLPKPKFNRKSGLHFGKSLELNLLPAGQKEVLLFEGEKGLQKKTTWELGPGQHLFHFVSREAGPGLFRRVSNGQTLDIRLVDPRLMKPNIKAHYYEFEDREMVDFVALERDSTPKKTYKLYEASLEGIEHRKNKFAVIYYANFQAKEAGEYLFDLTSDDGSQMWLDGKLVHSHHGTHGARSKRESLKLEAKTYALKIGYFQNGGGASMSFKVKAPSEKSLKTFFSYQ